MWDWEWLKKGEDQGCLVHEEFWTAKLLWEDKARRGRYASLQGRVILSELHGPEGNMCHSHNLMVTVWWSLCDDYCVVVTVWLPQYNNHCVMVMLIIVWWPRCDYHCVMTTLWQPPREGNSMLTTVWWSCCDDHTVMATMWWSWCNVNMWWTLCDGHNSMVTAWRPLWRPILCCGDCVMVTHDGHCVMATGWSLLCDSKGWRWLLSKKEAPFRLLDGFGFCQSLVYFMGFIPFIIPS